MKDWNPVGILFPSLPWTLFFSLLLIILSPVKCHCYACELPSASHYLAVPTLSILSFINVGFAGWWVLFNTLVPYIFICIKNWPNFHFLTKLQHELQGHILMFIIFQNFIKYFFSVHESLVLLPSPRLKMYYFSFLFSLYLLTFPYDCC